MEKSQKAVERFLGGLNCAQAVLAEYAADHGCGIVSALRIASGFGGGMGLSGGTCGAITGAIMAIGLLAPGQDLRDPDTKAYTYGLVETFLEEFKARNQATDCRDLLGCDLSTLEGPDQAVRLELFETKCTKYVADAIEILEDMF